MGMFECAGCKSKDDQIQWLRARYEELQKEFLAVTDKQAFARTHPSTTPRATMPPPPKSPAELRDTIVGGRFVGDTLDDVAREEKARKVEREKLERSFAKR